MLTRFVLDDSDLRTLVELACSVSEAVLRTVRMELQASEDQTNLRNNGIRIDNENDVTNAQGLRIGCPRFPFLAISLVDLLDSHLQRTFLQRFFIITEVTSLLLSLQQ